MSLFRSTPALRFICDIAHTSGPLGLVLLRSVMTEEDADYLEGHNFHALIESVVTSMCSTAGNENEIKHNVYTPSAQSLESESIAPNENDEKNKQQSDGQSANFLSNSYTFAAFSCTSGITQSALSATASQLMLSGIISASGQSTAQISNVAVSFMMDEGTRTSMATSAVTEPAPAADATAAGEGKDDAASVAGIDQPLIPNLPLSSSPFCQLVLAHVFTAEVHSSAEYDELVRLHREVVLQRLLSRSDSEAVLSRVEELEPRLTSLCDKVKGYGTNGGQRCDPVRCELQYKVTFLQLSQIQEIVSLLGTARSTHMNATQLRSQLDVFLTAPFVPKYERPSDNGGLILSGIPTAAPTTQQQQEGDTQSSAPAADVTEAPETTPTIQTLGATMNEWPTSFLELPAIKTLASNFAAYVNSEPYLSHLESCPKHWVAMGQPESGPSDGSTNATVAAALDMCSATDLRSIQTCMEEVAAALEKEREEAAKAAEEARRQEEAEARKLAKKRK
eukprot:PhM_4_TR16206/c0_g1_i1/m.42223